MGLVELEVGAPAHGGHCVARLDGRVVFVRHTLPGERVRAQVTSTGSRFWRADAVEVLEPSDDRVDSPWPAAGPGGVGGAELAHVRLEAQRRWKAQVLAEQLRRLAHDDRLVTVLAAPGDDERGGLAYRTRVDLVTDDEGRAGMFGWHSHEVHALDAMPLAVETIADLHLFDRVWPAQARIVVAAGADDPPVVVVDEDVWDLRRHCADQRPTARRAVREQVGDASYRVAADGFWQAHRAAPGLLVEAVLAGVGDVDGAAVADLYAGAGLFTVPLAAAVGEAGQVVAVEGDVRAVRDARRNVHHLPQVTLCAADVRDGIAETIHC
ncbi:MAG: TRAM domain-containing protein, partial [Micrococcales bacterium]|nr:TRAM domain-containing protein [Micrococcales bacterium]